VKLNLDKTLNFIIKAKKMHGNKFSYENCVYDNAKTKVSITCKIHGDFQQRPSSHLEGYGCKRCALEELRQKKLNLRSVAVCPTCETEFSFPKSEQKKGRKFCSIECSKTGRTIHQDIICEQCGKQFKPKTFTTRFCSLKCTANYNRSDASKVITSFVKKYGKTYDYGQVVYANMRTEVIIGCKKHGQFSITPIQHLQGKICPECKKIRLSISKKLKKTIPKRKLSNEELQFIKDAGPRFISCTCENCHAELYSTRSNKDRRFCSNKCKMTFLNNEKYLFWFKQQQIDFSIESLNHKLSLLYADKINALSVDFKKESKMHTITCQCERHGIFQATSGYILEGSDCPFCRDRRINRARFLERTASEPKISEKGYDYSLVTDFSDPQSEYVTIICPNHGSFEQTPIRHLTGDGCKKCAIETRGMINQAKASANWPENAFKVHGNAYDYKKAVYNGAKISTEIICPNHGIFEQTPNNHLNGAGCPKCADEIRNIGSTIHELQKNNIDYEGSLYVLECLGENEHFFKIGITTRTVEQRYNSIASMPYSYSVLVDLPLGLITAYQTEQRILNDYSEYLYKPQIYFGGITECLYVNPCEIDDELQNHYMSFVGHE
jgi:hypothetical protein